MRTLPPWMLPSHGSTTAAGVRMLCPVSGSTTALEMDIGSVPRLLLHSRRYSTRPSPRCWEDRNAWWPSWPNSTWPTLVHHPDTAPDRHLPRQSRMPMTRTMKVPTADYRPMTPDDGSPPPSAATRSRRYKVKNRFKRPEWFGPVKYKITQKRARREVISLVIAMDNWFGIFVFNVRQLVSYSLLFHCYVLVFYCYVSNSHICYVIHGLVVSVSVFWLRVEVIAQAPTCYMQDHSLGVMFSFSVVNEAWQLQLTPLMFWAYSSWYFNWRIILVCLQRKKNKNSFFWLTVFLTFNCFVFQIQIVRLSALTVKFVTLEALTHDVTVLRMLL